MLHPVEQDNTTQKPKLPIPFSPIQLAMNRALFCDEQTEQTCGRLQAGQGHRTSQLEV